MILRFGRCEVDLDRVEIRVDGLVVAVQPQVFDVIVYLAERRDRVVSKEELLDNVWGDRFVGESALTSRIKSARKALADTGRDQGVIRTVHGRGYRFVAEVEVLDSAAATSPMTRSSAGSTPSGATPPAERGEIDGLAPGPSGAGDGMRRQWPFVGRYAQIDQVLACLAGNDVGGVVVSGAGGSGTSRLVAECMRHVAARGHATAAISGHASMSSIPLGALAPFLPAEVLTIDDLPHDLARAAVFRRAQAAIEALSPDRGRFVLAVDAADQLDQLSEAVLTSLVVAGSLFVIASHRPSPQRPRAFDDLVRSHRMVEIELPPLDDTDIDIILYRVLDGPIDLASLERLAAGAAGRPGMLRDLVETSIRSGALAQYDGVWRLVGPVASHTSTTWPLAELSDDAVRATEQLALVTTLHLDDAIRILGADAVDGLDAAGLLALTRDPDGDVLSLADPVLRDAVVSSIGPVRSRRLKAALVDELLAGQRRPDDIATSVGWADELGRSVDPLDALLAARTAIQRGHDDAAETLVAHLERSETGPNPYARAIRAELCYRRMQFARAEELFAGIDLSVLDDHTVAFVLRRRSSIEYQVHGRYRDSVAWLEEQEATASPTVRLSLAVHRLTLLTLLGDAADVVAETDRLVADARGVLAVELRLARSRALMMCGRVDDALGEADEVERAVQVVHFAGPEKALPREAALSTRLSIMLNVGEIDRAAELVRLEDVAGRRAVRTWVPLMAAEVEIEAGRVRAAREMVRPALESARRMRFDNATGASEALFAWTSAGLGLRDEAEVMLDVVWSTLPRMAGANTWHMAISIGRAAALLGPDASRATARRREVVTLLCDLADEAQRRGAVLSEANLRFTAALVDPDAQVAHAGYERIAAFADAVGGRLWPVKADHVQALAHAGSTAPVAAAYRELGYHQLAAIAAQT